MGSERFLGVGYHIPCKGCSGNMLIELLLAIGEGMHCPKCSSCSKYLCIKQISCDYNQDDTFVGAIKCLLFWLSLLKFEIMIFYRL